MIGGTVVNNGDELNFSRYLYFEISANTNTTVTYDSTTVSLNSGDTINISDTGTSYFTFFTSIVSNPDIVALGIVRLSTYIENNPTEPVSFRSGLEPQDCCDRFTNTTIVSNPINPTFFLLTEDGDFLTDEMGNRITFI